jgi:diguanylate cyclase (GGDEF)-like protein
MTSADVPSISYLNKRLARERVAREQAEQLLESKSRALYEANQNLANTNERLDVLVQERTCALLAEKEKAQGIAKHLTTTLERLELVLTATKALSWTYDIQERKFQQTHGDRNILSIETEHWVPLASLRDYLHPNDLHAFDEAFLGDAYLRPSMELRLRLRNEAGAYRWFSMNACVSRSETNQPLLVGSLIDINDQAVREEQAWSLANIDNLTQVANRYYFEQLFAQTQAKAQDLQRPFTLAMIDINEFKLINESFGQRTADQALQRLAELLQEHFDGSATVARLAADEFTILFRVEVAPSVAVSQIETLIGSVDHFILGSNERVAITLSAGAACFPEHGASMDSLLQAVQTANQQSKQSRYSQPTCVVYRSELDVKRQRHLFIRQLLEVAVRNQEFSFVLQPIVSPRGRWVAAEALLRWTRSPSDCSTQEFISVAEACGLILPIGEWVIYAALQQLEELHRSNPRFGLSINVSAAQFQHQDIALLIKQAASGRSCDLSRLTVEVTESLFVDDINRVRSSLNGIKALGCGIAIDDFGSGYSSLSYVQQLPIDHIKIDKRFIDQIREDDSRENIVRAIIDMGHSMGSKIVAEGVETQWQAERLGELNCDGMQGYFFARPMPPAQLLSELPHRT